MTFQPGDEYLFPDGSTIIVLWVDEALQRVWIVTGVDDYVLDIEQWEYIVKDMGAEDVTETRSTES